MIDPEVSKATQFSSTNQPKKNGRKPSKLKAFIKENDLGKKDVELIARGILEMGRDELMKLANDQAEPILVTGFAAALLMDMKKGSTSAITLLMERAVGKIKDEIEIKDRRFSDFDIELTETEEKEYRKQLGLFSGESVIAQEDILNEE